MDSTPKWSKRGWIRRVLDSAEADSRRQLLVSLNDLGSLSNTLGTKIESCKQEKMPVNIVSTPTIHWKIAKGDLQHETISTVLVHLDGIMDSVDSVADDCRALLVAVERVANFWNPLLAKAKAIDDGTEDAKESHETVSAH